MTVKELKEELTKMVQRGHGDAPVLAEGFSGVLGAVNCVEMRTDYAGVDEIHLFAMEEV